MRLLRSSGDRFQLVPQPACPKCQSTARDRWLAKQAQELLPIPYCHVVFTVPQALAPLGLQNQRRFHALLFRAVFQTLLEIAADRRHLGARIGFLAVLQASSASQGPLTALADPTRFEAWAFPSTILSAWIRTRSARSGMSLM